MGVVVAKGKREGSKTNRQRLETEGEKKLGKSFVGGGESIKVAIKTMFIATCALAMDYALATKRGVGEWLLFYKARVWSCFRKLQLDTLWRCLDCIGSAGRTICN